MEACGGAHHWCRQLLRMGLDARMMAAALVTPYRMQGKGGKNDANDAAAICEAASRPPDALCDRQNTRSAGHAVCALTAWRV